jgi:hypothetical protein
LRGSRIGEHEVMTGPRDAESPADPGNPGTEAQEADPTVGPGTHPDSESDAADDDTTPGGRP